MAVRRVIAALAAAGLGLFVTVSSPALGVKQPYLLPLGSVMVAAWYAGFSTGLLTAAVLVVGIGYWLVPPVGSFGIEDSGDLVRLGIFLAVAIAMSAIIERGRRTAATLQATLWSIDDGVIVTDRQAKVVFLNPVAQRLTGWGSTEAYGKSVNEVYGLLDEQTRDPAPSRIETMLRDSALREGMILGPSREHLLRARDGTERPIIDSGASVVDERGSRVGAVIVFRDITDQRAAREAAERANRLKDEFLATLSHELRTPLNAILGWTKMLRGGAVPPSGTSRALEAIDRNADSLARLVNDLLDVSRIVTGRLRLQPVPTDLARLIRESVDAISPAIAAKGVELSVRIGDVPPIVVDPDRVRQIIWNLMSNAVKFTPPRGEIAVTVRHESEHVQLVVADTGRGIEPDALPQVFNRFWQADGATNRTTGGLGLGLAIVRHLVEAHAGWVTATSDGIDRGATFTVTLPVVAPRQEDAAHAPQAHAGATALVGVDVLAVDDEIDALELVSAALRRHGAIVRTAQSADEAIQACVAARPAILVADIGMPGKDGFALMQELRAAYGGTAIPAIALTAYAGDVHRQAALNAGFLEHVEKPVNPDQLAAIVGELARRQPS
jgi:PAS domain S-box-containing protein